MPREGELLLLDMLEACENIKWLTAGMDLAQFLTDKRTRWAVERQLSILGEASYILGRTRPDLAGRVPEHRDIVRFRHVLIHHYSQLQDDMVWDVVENDLAALEHTLRALVD